MIRRAAVAVIDFYLYSNIHIALCGVALTATTGEIFQFPLRHELLIFVFCGTFFGYNIQRLPSAFRDVDVKRKFRRHHWNTTHRKFLAVVSAVAAVAAAWAYFHLYRRSQIIAIVPAFLSLAYAFPLIPGIGKWFKLREVRGIKIFVIAVVWSMSCALLPAAAADVPGEMWFSIPVLLWAVVCGLLIFALTLPFDIRDIDYDGQRLRTLPWLIGARGAILLAVGVLVLSDVLFGVIRFASGDANTRQFVAYFAWSFISALVISQSSPRRHDYFFSFLIDGLIILLWVMVWGATYWF